MIDLPDSDPPQPPTRAKPVEFSQELADYICTELANGRSLRAICKDTDMPAVGSVFRWINLHPSFREQYARARDMQVDALADEIIEIADTEPDPQKARVRVDARKWYAGRMKPKVYGERADGTQVNVNVVTPGYVVKLGRRADGPLIEGDPAQISAQPDATPSIPAPFRPSVTVHATDAPTLAPPDDEPMPPEDGP